MNRYPTLTEINASARPCPPVSPVLKRLASEALAVQDACNLSGVVHGFSRAISALREALPNAGTHAINTHPICLVWADKIAHLTGTQMLGMREVMDAHMRVREILAAPEAPAPTAPTADATTETL